MKSVERNYINVMQATKGLDASVIDVAEALLSVETKKKQKKTLCFRIYKCVAFPLGTACVTGEGPSTNVNKR